MENTERKTNRRCSDGRRWADHNQSCVIIGYAIFLAYGFGLGLLVSWAAR
jgi:hypothetical protein